jgi:hypothetical protein
MSEQGDRRRFDRLPEPVRPEDAVETVDTSSLPVSDRNADRDRVLRAAGGG